MVIILYLWYIQNGAPKLLLMAQPLKHPQSESAVRDRPMVTMDHLWEFIGSGYIRVNSNDFGWPWKFSVSVSDHFFPADLHNYAHTVWPRMTECGRVTRVKMKNVSKGSSHARTDLRGWACPKFLRTPINDHMVWPTELPSLVGDRCRVLLLLFITHKMQHKKTYIIQIQHTSKTNKKEKFNQLIKPQ